MPVSDLSVVKSGPTEVSAAAPAQYELAYANAGPSTATDVVITDTLPTGLTPRPAPGCTISGQAVMCAVGAVGVDETGTVTITADVDPALALGTKLTDVASIADRATGALDPDGSDNSSQASSTVAAENDVGVTVTANEAEVRAGDSAGYTVVITNHGPQVANAVTLVNTMPQQLVTPTASLGSARALPMQVSPGCLPTGVTQTCALGDLAVGASRTIVFGGTVAAGTQAGTVLTDSATVSFDGVDGVAANNQSSATIVVIAVVVTTTTTVHSGGGGGGGSLPATGAAIGALLLISGGTLFLGTGLRAAAADRLRRRRRR